MPWYERDACVLAKLNEVRGIGKPIYIGVSRESFISKITEVEDPSRRLHGSLVATALAVFNWADVIMTHDVGETVNAVKVAKCIRFMR
jgi:dihydropteroate synthase